MTPRSFLYVPAVKPALFGKAVAGEADAVIVDLEDTVPPSRKSAARVDVRRWLDTVASTGTEIWIRSAPEFLAEDLVSVACPRLTGVVVAKSSVETLARADELLSGLERTRALGRVELIGLIESARGLRALPEMATCNRVRTFGIGEVDLLADLRVKRSPEAATIIDTLRIDVVVGCAAAGVGAPVAPTSTDFRDLDAFEQSTAHLVRMGFRARTALHPKQVPIINAALSPSEDDVVRARRLLELYDLAKGEATVDDDGRFVDEAVIRGAREILARA